ADVVSEAVRDRHVLDRPIQAFPRIACLDGPPRVDVPIEAQVEGVTLNRFHIGLNCRITRVGFRRAQVLVLYESATHTRGGAGYGTAGACCHRWSDRWGIQCIEGVHALVAVVAAEGD